MIFDRWWKLNLAWDHQMIFLWWCLMKNFHFVLNLWDGLVLSHVSSKSALEKMKFSYSVICNMLKLLLFLCSCDWLFVSHPSQCSLGNPFSLQLTDFGLSKVGLINSTEDLSGPSESNSSFIADDKTKAPEKPSVKRKQRQKHSVVGTPDYLAPEILLGTGHGLKIICCWISWSITWILLML